MDYLLDPFIIQIPRPFETKTHLIEYLVSLSKWCLLLIEPNDDNFWFSAPALEELWASGQFPGYNNLLDIFNDINDNNMPFDPVIASRALERLNLPPYIDDELYRFCPEIHEILIDDKDVCIIPDEIRTRLMPNVADALILTFTKLAYIHNHFGVTVFKDLFFATRTLDVLNEHIELKTKCYHVNSGNYYDIKGRWRSAFEPCRTFNIEEKWTNIAETINWAFKDLVKHRELDPVIHKLPPTNRWSVGKHFYESIYKNHFDNQDTLTEIFHSVVKILIQYWGPSDHDHNKRLKKDTNQIIRKADGAIAWRAHVTNEPDMLRLHYWVINGNQIEFSNVVFHNNFCID